MWDTAARSPPATKPIRQSLPACWARAAKVAPGKTRRGFPDRALLGPVGHEAAVAYERAGLEDRRQAVGAGKFQDSLAVEDSQRIRHHQDGIRPLARHLG